MRRPVLIALPAAALALVLAACSGSPGTVSPSTAAPDPSYSAPTPTASGASAAGVVPAGDPVVVASGFDVPWSIVPLADGGALISERGTALVKEVAADGSVRTVGKVPGVVPAGEGGLLGLATLADGSTTWLYAYTTASDDNRVIRMPLTGAPGSFGLDTSAPQVILDGIIKNTTHNGGRIAFGPDGDLYITAGDAQRRPSAQDPLSRNGKILRVAPDGSIPADNPFPGSATWSYGHRNPQGIAWDASGQLYAAEFGQDTWDEFNRIQKGANYGWPVVEGIGDDPAYVNPLVQWATSDASPSGLAFIDGTFFLAALRGQRVWSIRVQGDGTAAATPLFAGDWGRIRATAQAPDGSLWFITNDTGDDKLMRVPLRAAA